MLVLFALLWLLFPLPTERLTPSASLRILDREGRLLRVYLSREDTYSLPIPLDQMSPYLVHATVAYEDRWFAWHPGINPGSVLRAVWLNMQSGRVVSGGSTLTQQVARMMQPRPRTLSAKLIEAFRALQLEVRYSKRQILGFYLNLAPYGGNIVGAEAASLLYFGKRASELNPGEAALLAALPTSPTLLRPDRAPKSAKGRRDIVLERMLHHGDIDEEHYRVALEAPVPRARQRLPRHAPHFCDDLAAQYGERGGDLRTTIDLKVQELTERLVERRMTTLRLQGVGNGAVVIIDNNTSSLLAMVGSADYGDSLHQGQVNGATSPRSPGSTLKPFIYGLGIDRGTITASSLLEDIPVNYAGYSPENYDQHFQGVVTVEQALSHSMNVPAVNLTRDIGLDRLMTLLQRGGISTLDETPGHYGLSLILGGVGIRLEELTNLYAGLAHGGECRPLRRLADEPVVPGEKILSPGATYLLTTILTTLKRPDFPTTWQATTHLPKIAWKTGTSYGHRDAWSIGYSPSYTVGVWTGNFDGRGNPVLVGADASAPLLFDLFTALEPEGGSWFARPDVVGEREVCILSGQLAGPDCGPTKRELYLLDRSSAKRCELHVSCLVDDYSHVRLCPHCRVGRPYHRESFVQWPPAIATWMRRQGASPTPMPAHDPTCPAVLAAHAPEIRSPAANISFILRKGVPLEDQRIPLEAAATADVKTLYWFMDGVLLGKAPPDSRLYYTPEEGQHKLVCMDDEGREATRTVLITH